MHLNLALNYGQAAFRGRQIYDWIYNYRNKNKKALIFGVSGQDGAYLSNLLLKKNYIVHGITRSKKYKNT